MKLVRRESPVAASGITTDDFLSDEGTAVMTVTRVPSLAATRRGAVLAALRSFHPFPFGWCKIAAAMSSVMGGGNCGRVPVLVPVRIVQPCSPASGRRALRRAARY